MIRAGASACSDPDRLHQLNGNHSKPRRSRTGSHRMYLSQRMLVPEHRKPSEVFELAEAIGARLTEDISHPIENGITREVTWEVFPGLLLQYAEDARSFSAFTVIAGDLKEKVDHFSARVAEYLQSPTFDELIGAATVRERDTPATSTRDILRLGIASPRDPDPRFLDYLHETLQDVNPELRAAGLASMLYSFWPDFQPLLKVVTDTDTSEILRDEASAMLTDSIEMYGEFRTGPTA